MDKSTKARAGKPKRHPNYPAEFKRRLVEESLAPDASVALIARMNNLNANLLFKWRRQHLREIGHAANVPSFTVSTPGAKFAALLPVSIVEEALQQSPAIPDRGAPGEDICEVEFNRARLRIRGEVSPSTLRLLIRELSR